MSVRNMKNTPAETRSLDTYDSAKIRWDDEVASQTPSGDQRKNHSRIKIKPLYGPDDWDSARHMKDLGFPGQSPTTRGIHASMHRGRPWSPRMVVGFGIPEDYNKRMRDLCAVGLSGLFLAPCNSHMRGYDPDDVERKLLGTCGTLISTTQDMDICLDGIPFDTESISLGDTAPYTLSAMLLCVAKQRSIPWSGLVVSELLPVEALVGLLSVPLAIYVTVQLFRHFKSRAIKTAQAGTIYLHLVTGLLLVLGVWLAI